MPIELAGIVDDDGFSSLTSSSSSLSPFGDVANDFCEPTHYGHLVIDCRGNCLALFARITAQVYAAN